MDTSPCTGLALRQRSVFDLLLMYSRQLNATIMTESIVPNSCLDTPSDRALSPSSVSLFAYISPDGGREILQVASTAEKKKHNIELGIES